MRKPYIYVMPMSDIRKEWKLLQQPDAAVAALSRELEVLPLTARLLYNRGFQTVETAKPFVHKEIGRFTDPFQLRDMDRAVVRIKTALARNEKICVYGDYDADGVTATTILYQYLRDCGADVMYYIPSRLDEGYGLCASAIRRLADEKVSLILTVDTGVTAIAEAALIKECGMSLVVTDHHECRPDLPDAAAVVDPRRPDCPYPFKELAGVGVAFKLICAMETFTMVTNREKMTAVIGLCRRFGDYVAIGTVADVMALTEENRLFVNIGLLLLEKEKKPGLLALMDRAGAPTSSERSGQDGKYPPKKRKITSSFIGFTIAPRINAAGRISHADRAVELFLTDSPEEADRLAGELCDANRERQDMENSIAKEAYAQIEAEHDLTKECILILAGEHWHHGVIGIVASRITEKYHKPTILLSFDGDEAVGTGSGRSIEGFNLVNALADCAELLERFGGHALAAGMTVTREKLPLFRKRMEQAAQNAFGGTIPPAVLPIDCVTAFADITLRTANDLFCLEPYGTGNPVPVFALNHAQIRRITPLSGGRHTKLILCDPADETETREALLFGVPTDTFAYCDGDIVDVAYQMEINDFNNTQTVQMLVQDIHPVQTKKDTVAMQKRIYEAVRSGTGLPDTDTAAALLPEREDFKKLYILLRTLTQNGGMEVSIAYEVLAERAGIPYGKLRLSLDIFQEAGLISAHDGEEPDSVILTLLPQTGKVNLGDMPLLRRLHTVLEHK